MSRILILLGVALIAVGILWPWLQKLGLGHLPGDFLIERGNFRFYFPLATSILVSAVISVLFWIFYR